MKMIEKYLEPKMSQPKIFCIGFHKTGTSSLMKALRILGYRSGKVELSVFQNPNIAQEVYDIVAAQVEQYDAFSDNPWPIIYQELDQKYPHSKFILTLRSTASWVKSVVKYFGATTTPMREWIYGVGSPAGNETIYAARFDRHNREVLEYFRDRPDDLLVMNFAEGAGWESLCRFLGKEIPTVPFPHVNKAGVLEKRQSSQPRFKQRVEKEI